MARVSVVVIFLNPGAFIDDAIRSVVGQTYDDWELLLVDDGSSDDGTRIAREWAERLPDRVRYLEHEKHAHRGKNASRNLGLQVAVGEYIAFLDADDRYLPERLARHLAILDRWPQVDAVQSDHVHWHWWRDRRGSAHEAQYRRPAAFLGDAVLRPPDGLRLLFGVPEIFIGICSLTIRREAALELGGFEERFGALFEDQVFLTKIYAHRTVYWLQECLAMYRMHPGGSFAVAVAGARDPQSEYFTMMRRLREWQLDYLEGTGAELAEVPEMLRRLAAYAGDPWNARSLVLRFRVGQALHGLLRWLPTARFYGWLLRRRQMLSEASMLRHHAGISRRRLAERRQQRRTDLAVALDAAGPCRTEAPAAVPAQSAPRVSVIAIFHNEERFLAQAIESVLAQTCVDWELVLVDDGSADGGTAVARAYSERFPARIRYLEHPGHVQLGMSASRNLGLQNARGAYVTFLDGDDVYLPQRLERHVAVLDVMAGIDVVQSDLLHWQSWRGDGSPGRDDYVRPGVCFTDRLVPAPLALWTLVAVPFMSPGVYSLTLRRSVAIALGGFEARFRSLFEDQVFLTKVYAAHAVYVIEDYLVAHRIHPGSAVERARLTAHSATGEWQVARRAFMEWRLQYLRSLPDPSGLLGRVIAEAEAQVRPSGAGFVDRSLARLRAASRQAAESLLPQRVFESLAARRRRLADRQTLAAYAQLCRRAHEAVTR